jgi:hypothetical protein
MRFEIEQRLQVFPRNSILGELSDHAVEAFGAQGDDIARGTAPMRLPQRSERRPDAANWWRKGLHGLA